MVPEGESVMVVLVGVGVGSGDRSLKLGNYITAAPRKQRENCRWGQSEFSVYLYGRLY